MPYLCCFLQGRWARYEEELERAHATQQALSMDQGKASKQQIFSRYAAATIGAQSQLVTHLHSSCKPLQLRKLLVTIAVELGAPCMSGRPSRCVQSCLVITALHTLPADSCLICTAHHACTLCL